MARSAGRQLLAALRESLAGRQKLVAHETWPGANDAEARMSRVLSGELNPPPELLVLALRGPGGERLLDYLRGVAACDPSELRRQAIRLIHEGQVQMAFAFEALEAEKAERDRKGPIRVEPQPHSGRRVRA